MQCKPSFQITDHHQHKSKPKISQLSFITNLATMKGGLVAMFVVVAMVQFLIMALPGEAITCGQVDSSWASCVPYLTGGGSPSAACCDGVKSIKANTPTTADRQATCEGMKAAAARCPDLKEDAASSLPQKCGVELSIPISKNINCQSIN